MTKPINISSLKPLKLRQQTLMNLSKGKDTFFKKKATSTFEYVGESKESGINAT
jgi:hypothetical protein